MIKQVCRNYNKIPKKSLFGIQFVPAHDDLYQPRRGGGASRVILKKPIPKWKHPGA